jgi:cell division topological specificity factor
LKLFDFLFGKKQNSKNVAKERLKLVLIHDRANVSPEFLEMIRNEILQVISNYIDIDYNAFDIQLTKTKSEDGLRFVPALVVNAGIKGLKRYDRQQDVSL